MAEWQSARLESVSPLGVLGSNPSPGVSLDYQPLQTLRNQVPIAEITEGSPVAMLIGEDGYQILL
jgi:hypothetical protein